MRKRSKAKEGRGYSREVWTHYHTSLGQLPGKTGEKDRNEKVVKLTEKLRKGEILLEHDSSESTTKTGYNVPDESNRNRMETKVNTALVGKDRMESENNLDKKQIEHLVSERTKHILEGISSEIYGTYDTQPPQKNGLEEDKITEEQEQNPNHHEHIEDMKTNRLRVTNRESEKSRDDKKALTVWDDYDINMTDVERTSIQPNDARESNEGTALGGTVCAKYTHRSNERIDTTIHSEEGRGDDTMTAYAQTNSAQWSMDDDDTNKSSAGNDHDNQMSVLAQRNSMHPTGECETDESNTLGRPLERTASSDHKSRMNAGNNTTNHPVVISEDVTMTEAVDDLVVQPSKDEGASKDFSAGESSPHRDCMSRLNRDHDLDTKRSTNENSSDIEMQHVADETTLQPNEERALPRSNTMGSSLQQLVTTVKIKKEYVDNAMEGCTKDIGGGKLFDDTVSTSTTDSGAEHSNTSEETWLDHGSEGDISLIQSQQDIDGKGIVYKRKSAMEEERKQLKRLHLMHETTQRQTNKGIHHTDISNQYPRQAEQTDTKLNQMHKKRNAHREEKNQDVQTQQTKTLMGTTTQI